MGERVHTLLFAALLALGIPARAQITPARLPATPDIHGDKVVFSAEGDLWLANLASGTAQRITTDEGVETQPKFSPDGNRIAFTGSYDGGRDVYVMPVEGGAPRRLTYDPAGAEMVCWTPDGKQILFRSRRASAMGPSRLYLVSAEGGLPKPLPMEKGAQASYSPDGTKLAFDKLALETHRWKRYHGGEANSIWIANLASRKFHRIDADTVNEQYPVWVGNSVYYVSERDGTANLWRYDTSSGTNSKVTHKGTYDVLSPSSDGRKVVFVWGDQLWTYDIASGREEELKLSLVSDMIHARPYSAPGVVSGFDLGPTGKRVVLLGRGQLFTAPAESGDIREIANIPGTRSKDPAWSPDGKWIAFVSDRSREENIWLAPSGGDGEARQLTRESHLIISQPQWSPDSHWILYHDVTQAVYLVDAATGSKAKVDQSDWGDINDCEFSPDSKWIAYSKMEGLVVRSLYLYEIANKQATRLTFPPTIDSQPTFDPEGKYLYFVSNRSLVAKSDDIDFQMDFTKTAKIYAFALAKDTPAPIPLDNDEEPGSLPAKKEPETTTEAKKETKKESDEADAEDEKHPAETKIDFDHLSDRIVELPVPAGEIHNVYGLKESVMYVEDNDDGDGFDLKAFGFKSKKERTLAQDVAGVEVSADGKKMAVKAGPSLQIVDAGSEVSGPEGRVDLSTWRVGVEPVKEWKQIFEQAWRQHRDIFYDPNLHGMDWDGVRRKYEELLPSIGSRSELNELIGNMQGEMNVSHEFVFGGNDRFQPPPAPGFGSLGADLAYDDTAKAYKVARIFRGDGFDAVARSPLLMPGVNVEEGEFVLSINGVKLSSQEDPNKLLIGQAGHIVRLEVNAKPTSEGSRTVRIKAMASEARARYYDWVALNRAYVEKYGGPNLGYIHIPDMGEDGMQEFSKHFYANLDKDGLVIDVRYNRGGDTSGQVLERLRRVIFEFDQPRYGTPQPYHRMGYLGRVVVLCNEETSSDGEYFCTGFRYEKLGPVIGARTWGGFMAVGGFPMIDGGVVTTPVAGSFTPEGKWLPDGTGFTPDYLVEEDPNAFVAGRDPQMDKALELLKEEIRKDPPKWPKRLDPPSKEKAFKH